MPVGIPRLPFVIVQEEEEDDDDDDYDWMDLYNVLYRSRTLFLGQEIDYEIANHLAGLMIFLNIEDPTKDLYFFINSPGGLATAGLLIYDAMQLVKPDVYTLGLGLLASMASFLLVGGAISKRLLTPHSRVMIHQPASDYTGKDPAIEAILDAEEVEQIRDMVIRVYVQRTQQPREVINDHLERNLFMSATEAKDYGLIDDIGVQDVLARIREQNPHPDSDPDLDEENPYPESDPDLDEEWQWI
uniref:ATP-dependent Clp protease proteolytic subunit n=1 Tax=Oenothera nuttallii TaxID=337558 RepID=A0A0Y0UU28_9MYRT|nr:ATP-dependent Clp protease proteolytic subunit [Oenothera nuttallii]